MKRLVVDLDGTITQPGDGQHYASREPNLPLIARLREYKSAGFEIVIYTSRNMRTHGGNVGRINVETLPIILDWLNEHDIPHDEVHVGKPWCGHDGFYIDDRAVRPDEFVDMDYGTLRDRFGL